MGTPAPWLLWRKVAYGRRLTTEVGLAILTAKRDLGGRRDRLDCSGHGFSVILVALARFRSRDTVKG